MKHEIKRPQRKSSLIIGEGLAEEKFLTYLKGKYHNRDANHEIKIPKCYSDGSGGGSSLDVVKRAFEECYKRHYDGIVILLDADILNEKTCIELCQQVRKSKSCANYKANIPKDGYIRCVIIIPCIENLLLKIINAGECKETKKCKEQFKIIFKKEAHQISQNEYEELFPEEVIAEACSRIPELAALISYMKLQCDKEEVFSSWFFQG